MDAIFEAQFRLIREEFAEEGVRIDVALRPDGETAYIYQVGRLLALDQGGAVARIQEILPGTRRTDEVAPGDLVVLTIEHLDHGSLSVPDALDVIDTALSKYPSARDDRGRLPVTPNHVAHLTRLCPADEPELPTGTNPATGTNPGPWPPPCPAGQCPGQAQIYVIDSGLMEDFDVANYPWMTGVKGEPDPLGTLQPSGKRLIDGTYEGHGTFVAGVAKCMAPSATVEVSNLFSGTGATLENQLIDALSRLLPQTPQLISLSAGMYTFNNQGSLGFDVFRSLHPDITLVAAAGNEATSDPFYPAAYPWAISVGALAADEQHLAWFSNFGPTVDVYALGEGLVNAYTSGEYTYQWPPKAPGKENFFGMARWSGTSFSTPLVAGLIASRMARTGEDAATAAQAVLGAARMQQIPGIGPVLRPCDQP
jgi:Subtilase family